MLLPSLVFVPPWVVPGFILTYSLSLLLSPIIIEFFSPLYFKSCGGVPIDTKGKISFFFPIFVFPLMLTCECYFEFESISTSGPITQYGPISTFSEILDFLLIMAV